MVIIVCLEKGTARSSSGRHAHTVDKRVLLGYHRAVVKFKPGAPVFET